MSVYSGPEISNDGLVFAYDMSNTQKSWKGAPVTNLKSNPDMSEGTSGYGSYVSTAPVVVTVFDFPESIGQAKTVLQCYSAAANGGGGNPGGMSFSNPTLTPGLSYTISFWARSVNLSTMSTTYSNQNGGGDQSNFSFNKTINDQWVRYTNTVSSLDLMKTTWFVWAGTVNAIWQYADIQIEQNSFATPFVKGTRSNTQAILDQTNNSTITTNSSISYLNNNTFEFLPGNSNSTLIVPLSTSLNKLTGTINAWVYPKGYSASNGIFVNREDSISNAIDWLWIGSWASGSTFYFRLGNGSDCCSQDLTVSNWSTVCPINTWSNVCVTWQSSSFSRIYVNGKLITSRNITSIPNTNPSATGRIGLGHADGASGSWNGAISNFSIFNRALTDAEIQQNFNALRGRFNI